MNQRAGVTRREFLAQAGILTGGAAVGAMGVDGKATAKELPELVTLTGVELSQKIHTRQVSCVEVMESYLAHIERYNPKVNAIVSVQARDTVSYTHLTLPTN